MRPSAELADLTAELATIVTALWYDIDTRGGAAAADYFTADAVLRFSDAEFHGTAEIAEVYATRAARGPRVSRHVAANLHIVDRAEHRVRAVSTLVLFGADGTAPRPDTTPAMVGDVLDEFALVDNRWLIASRWIQNMFISPQTRLAVPQASRGVQS